MGIDTVISALSRIAIVLLEQNRSVAPDKT